MEFKESIGHILLGINLLSMLIPLYGMYVHVKCCISSETRSQCNNHFLLVMACAVFLTANLIATYTGYISFIRNPHLIVKAVILPRIADRLCMLLVGLILIFVGRFKKFPKEE